MSRPPPKDIQRDIPVPLNRPAPGAAWIRNFSDEPKPYPHPNPTKSFWTDGEPGCNPLASAGGNSPVPEQVDVCIIGSGLTGVSCAYHLAQLVESGVTGPMKVVILEARDFCEHLFFLDRCYASTCFQARELQVKLVRLWRSYENPDGGDRCIGRNGGQLVAGRFSKMHHLTVKYGAEEAAKSPALEEYTVSEILRIIKENGWESGVDLVECRRINLVFNERELGGIESDIAAARRAKVSGIENVEFLTAEQVEKVIYSPLLHRISMNNMLPGIRSQVSRVQAAWK